MPVSFRQITANTATVTFDVLLTAEDGVQTRENVTMVYYPGRITEKTIGKLEAMGNMSGESVQEGYAGFNETLAYLIKSWDVYEDDSVEPPVMFPLEPKRLAELPIGFRLQVITAMTDDMRPETMAPSLNGHS